MAGRVRAQSLVAGLALPGLLVSYSFDEERVDTGPDTFAVYEMARGRVDLDGRWRTSGWRSVKIEEVAEDGDFAELQGAFPLVREGTLRAHFALLVSDPRQELNVALAGPGGFRLARDGIAVWLTTRDGWLAHVSDSITRRLLPLERFTWYIVDVRYDVARGRYDLTVAQERAREPLVRLRAQPNATSQPGGAVERFSFIGDLLDRSNAQFWVDDVVLASEPGVPVPALIAPGRRRLFFDAWLEAKGRQRAACPPLAGPADFGLDPAEARRLFEVLGSAELPPDAQARLPAAAAWKRGCAALEGGAHEAARAELEEAVALAPGAPLALASLAAALAAAGHEPEAHTLLGPVASAWRDDPRLPAALALGKEPFYELLWDDRIAEALALAEQHEGAEWLERAGDAAFLLADMERARARYERALELDPRRVGVLLKLADVHFLRGDLERERAARERIFGTL